MLDLDSSGRKDSHIEIDKEVGCELDHYKELDLFLIETRWKMRMLKLSVYSRLLRLLLVDLFHSAIRSDCVRVQRIDLKCSEAPFLGISILRIKVMIWRFVNCSGINIT